MGYFDWITPVAAFVRSRSGPPAADVAVHGSFGSGREINQLLDDHGIESWGYQSIDDWIVFCVRKADKQRVLELTGG